MDWLSVLIGGAITLVVSSVFYGLAARDLKREASELRQYTIMLINLLDDEGVINVERDAHGNPIRVIRREITDSVGLSDNVQVSRIIRRQVTDSLGISDTAQGELTRQDEQP